MGPGRRYLSTGGVLAALVGGWEVSGIITARTGQPVNVTVSRRSIDLPDQNSNSPQRPDRVPGVSLVPEGGRTVAQWINPAAFAIPAPGTWGNAGRNLVRAAGLAQVDLALTKRNRVTERLRVELRAEAFNLLNQPQYGARSRTSRALATSGGSRACRTPGPRAPALRGSSSSRYASASDGVRQFQGLR